MRTHHISQVPIVVKALSPIMMFFNITAWGLLAYCVEFARYVISERSLLAKGQIGGKAGRFAIAVGNICCGVFAVVIFSWFSGSSLFLRSPRHTGPLWTSRLEFDASSAVGRTLRLPPIFLHLAGAHRDGIIADGSPSGPTVKSRAPSELPASNDRKPPCTPRLPLTDCQEQLLLRDGSGGAPMANQPRNGGRIKGCALLVADVLVGNGLVRNFENTLRQGARRKRHRSLYDGGKAESECQTRDPNSTGSQLGRRGG